MLQIYHPCSKSWAICREVGCCIALQTSSPLLLAFQIRLPAYISSMLVVLMTICCITLVVLLLTADVTKSEKNQIMLLVTS